MFCALLFSRALIVFLFICSFRCGSLAVTDSLVLFRSPVTALEWTVPTESDVRAATGNVMGALYVSGGHIPAEEVSYLLLGSLFPLWGFSSSLCSCLLLVVVWLCVSLYNLSGCVCVWLCVCVCVWLCVCGCMYVCVYV